MGPAVPAGITGLSGCLRPAPDDALDDAGRVGLTRAIEELYTFSPLINRTRRRDIGEFTTRKPETVDGRVHAGAEANSTTACSTSSRASSPSATASRTSSS